MPEKKQNLELKPLLEERMKSLLGNEFKKYLEILKQNPVKSIRCNTLKISPAGLKQKLGKKYWIIKQPFKSNPEIMIVEGKQNVAPKSSQNNKEIDLTEDNKRAGELTRDGGGTDSGAEHQTQANEDKIRDLEPGELGRALEHLLGYYYIQEIVSMMPVIALQPKPNELVLDLCASPGSKTTQIAAKMENQGTIIANDVKLGRIKILSANMGRCGISNAILTKQDGIALCKKLHKKEFKFDKILLDAPCSGEGTLRSSPQTYKMWNIKTIKSLSRLQKGIISSAIKLLKTNGELVYSTCTHAPEENEDVIDFVLENFENIKIEKANLPIKCRPGLLEWAGREYNKQTEKSCRIYPQDNNTEGFFIAKLRKIKK